MNADVSLDARGEVQAKTDVFAAKAVAATREQLTSEGWVETGFAQANTAMAQIRFAKDDRITNVNFMDTGTQRAVQLVTMTL